MPGNWSHLAARFFDVLTARPLSPAERDLLGTWLRDREVAIFTTQADADQRHGLECGLDVATLHPDRRDLIRAAILHDVGKRHAGLGTIGRVFASVAARLHLPLRGRFALYARHGALGAEELERLGAEAFVIDFVRAHHGERPASIPEGDWQVLMDADRARLPNTRPKSGYPDGSRDGTS